MLYCRRVGLPQNGTIAPSIINPGPCFRPVLTSFGGWSATEIQFGSSAGECAKRICCFRHLSQIVSAFKIRAGLEKTNAALCIPDTEDLMLSGQMSNMVESRCKT